MKPVARDQLIDQLQWRYATKQYDRTRRIGAADWAALEEALVLSPSSLGLQPWTFLVVDDPAVRARLLPASYDQAQIVDASHLVVFATKVDLSEADVEAYVRRVADVRRIPVGTLAGLRQMAVGSIVQGLSAEQRRTWAVNQTYLALGNLVTSAALLGIDATPMEGFDRARYDEILGLKERGLAASVVLTLGYRSAADKYATLPKVRFAREEVVQHV